MNKEGFYCGAPKLLVRGKVPGGVMVVGRLVAPGDREEGEGRIVDG